MATIDSNGIVFLEETDPISPFHTTINTLQQGTSDAIGSFGSGSDGSFIIHYVANTTARSALATTYSPTASKPLYVYRGDATVGLELEVTENGSSWSALPTSGVPWTNLTLVSGWTAVSGSAPQYRVIGDTCELRGTAQYNSDVPTLTGLTNLVAAGGAPNSAAASIVLPVGSGNTGGTPVNAFAYINPRNDGGIRAGASGAGVRQITLDGVRYRIA